MSARDLAGFDVVHAHMSVVEPFTTPVVGLAARQGLPVVVTVHSLWSGLGPVRDPPSAWPGSGGRRCCGPR